MILYLHGFRSSPHSAKARLMAGHMADLGLADQWLCPQLPASPRESAELAQTLAQPHTDTLTIVGSSLGGYYATWLAEQLGARAVLLNPAVHAHRDLANRVGRHEGWHDGEPFDFLPHYVDELAALHVPRITRPERYFLVAATGDEVLDWREMQAHYPGARHRIIAGSDHGISDFAQWLPEVLAFAGIEPPSDSARAVRP